jgi:transposase
MDKQSLALLLGQGLSVERIAKRFDKHPSTVSYWMTKHGLAAVNSEKHAAKGGVDRARLEQLVASGMTIAELADEIELSKATVRHWMRRYELRTRAARRIEAERDARGAGRATISLVCPRHGETYFVLEGRGYCRCELCRQEQVARRRRSLKMTLVAEAGGRCCVCGYDRCVTALEFHHLDPLEKRLGISAGGLTLSMDALRVEAAKCVLLCPNCHAEVESGVSVVPLKWHQTVISIHHNPG